MITHLPAYSSLHVAHEEVPHICVFPLLHTFGKLLVTFLRKGKVLKDKKHNLGCLGNPDLPPYLGKVPNVDECWKNTAIMGIVQLFVIVLERF